MTANFKHINASEQIVDGTVTASLLAPNTAVLSIHADSNVNLTGNVQLVSGTNITLAQIGQAITVNATGELSSTLTNTHIFVGNASNVATDVALSGDATIANTGVLTLANTTVTPGAYSLTNLTVDSKGRLTVASSTTTGNLTDVGTDGIIITGGTGAVLGTGTSISQHVADATHSGYLFSTDWNTFNNKQPAGSYITALTGDVTASGPGSAAATLSNTAVTPGAYTNSSITVDSKGRLTSASTGHPVTSIHADSSSNITDAVQLVSGTNITLSQVGQAITVNSTASFNVNTILTSGAGEVLVNSSGNVLVS